MKWMNAFRQLLKLKKCIAENNSEMFFEIMENRDSVVETFRGDNASMIDWCIYIGVGVNKFKENIQRKKDAVNGQRLAREGMSYMLDRECLQGAK